MSSVYLINTIEDLKYCKLCLVTDVKMFTMNTPAIREAYSQLVQIVIYEAYEMYVCYECVSLLHKFQQFRLKCMTSLNVLSTIHLDHSKITKDTVQNIDRKLHNLNSKLACCATMQCNSNDQCPLPRDTFNTVQNDKLFIQEIKSELDVKLDTPKIEFEIDPPSPNDDSDDQNSVVKINIESIDYIPETKKKRKTLTNTKKRKLRTESNRKQNELNDSYNEPLAKRSLKTRSKGNDLKKSSKTRSKNKDNLQDNVGEPVKKKKGPKFDASCFKDYATVVLLTPEDAKKEVLLRKESSNYKISPYKCDLCYRGYEVKSAFDNHMKKHSPDYGILECEYCHLRFPERKSWTHHLLASHEYKFCCMICPFVCYYNYQAKVHMSLHKGKKYTCNECGLNFSMPNTLLMHKRMKHLAESACELCGRMFASKKGLVTHKMLLHRQENIEMTGPKCEECDVQFATETAFKRHLVLSSKHTVSNGCEYCGETFNDEKTLKIHTKVHSRKWRTKKFCKICDKWQKNRREYKSHMMSEHPLSEAAKKIAAEEQMPFVCEECGMAFKLQCFLQYHQMKHSSERPFECSGCDKTFKRRNDLYKHENIHTRKRVFQCDTCKKDYNTKGALVKHIMACHLGIRPHKCSYCDKSFPNPSDLKVHIKYVHYKVPWPKRDRTKRNATEESAAL